MHNFEIYPENHDTLSQSQYKNPQDNSVSFGIMEKAQVQYNEVNVSGVRVYNYYPLSVNYPLFTKSKPYSDATLGYDFATVLGFNASWRDILMQSWNQSGELLQDSLYYDSTRNLIHLQFLQRPSIDIYIYPGMLVSSDEMCNSTEWIEVEQLYNRRWNSVLWCDRLVLDFFGGNFFENEFWMRPCSDTSTIITSIRATEPSVTEHYIQRGRIENQIFGDLHFCAFSNPEAQIVEGSPLTLEYGFLELPHLVMWAGHLSYHDIVLVSYEDNPQVSTSIEFVNPKLPLGHTTMFSGVLWHTESLLRFGVNHATELKSMISEEFSNLDSLIGNLQQTASISSLETMLNLLSTDVKGRLSDYRLQIFDLQEIILHCSRISEKFSNTSYLIPFETEFNRLVTIIGEELNQITIRYDHLVSDFDTMHTILRQELADAQFLFNQQQSNEQFITQVNNAFWSLIISIAAALSLQIVSLGYKIRHNRIIDNKSERMQLIQIANAIVVALKKDELKQICQQNGFSTTGNKGELALRIINGKGREYAYGLLEQR